MRSAMLALAVLVLAACGGSSPTAPSGDVCAQSISTTITQRGQPDSRTDSGNTTVFYYGLSHIEFVRESDGSCFTSNLTPT